MHACIQEKGFPSCKLTCTDYIQQVNMKARRLVGMLYSRPWRIMLNKQAIMLCSYASYN